MTKVFVDGSAGTTGLRIVDRLKTRDDITLIRLAEEVRKDSAARKAAMAEADIVFLCLPDQAAVEAMDLVGEDTVVIDTSTAHRTAPQWVYGFAELEGQRELIRSSRRIANPGCHASGFIALVAPLVRHGLIRPETALTCFSLTGYSGGGKKMIAEYESEERPAEFDAPRQYGLTQNHKHLKEMQKITGLLTAPVFCPIVADYYSGMSVTVPLFAKDINGTKEDIIDLYSRIYHSPLVHYEPFEKAMAAGNLYSGRDDMGISVAGNDERVLLLANFDNLGKGASGAAIQNMNIIIGCQETQGLTVS